VEKGEECGFLIVSSIDFTPMTMIGCLAASLRGNNPPLMAPFSATMFFLSVFAA
jgi:hypothetical protein